MKRLVIDVSVWDGDVDFDQWIDRHDLWGVIVKCGGNERGRYRDRLFESHYDDAAASGANVGIYYYTTVTDPDEAAEDARHCLSIIDGRELDLPIYIDVEDAGQATIGRRALTDVILAFIRVIEDAGYKGGVYTSGSWWRYNVYADELRPYANWIAWWTGEKPSAIADVGLWQFGSMRLSDGDVEYGDVNGYTDANWCYVDYPSMGEGGGREMADELEGWAETLEECRDAADYAYCTCEAYSCGYSQPNRANISFESLRGGWAETDCSYGVATWLYWGDLLDDLYGFWTAIEIDYLTDKGFELLDADTTEPQRNDVLWRPGHTGMYIGDGMQAEALRTERHDAGYDGSTPGDQDGGETVVREYPAGGWTYILRPPNQPTPQPEPLPEIPDEGAGAVYRLYDEGNGAHFYTANLDEARRAVTWMDYEGVAWRVSGDGQPVYRLYDERSGDHFLTASESERDTARGWMTDEGVAFVTDGDVPVHRLYDEQSHQHFYTAFQAEYDSVKQWMTDEGIAFFGTSERPMLTYAAHVQGIGWMPFVREGEVAGTEGQSLRQEALRIIPPIGMRIDAMAHVQGIGDVWVRGIERGGLSTIGTVGEGRRMEGIALSVTRNTDSRTRGKTLQYRCHIQRIGWTEWCDEGNYCGTRGKKLRVEAVQMRFA